MEAESSPVPPRVVVGVRAARGEEEGSERERRMRWEMEGQREVLVLLALEESQGGELGRQRGQIKFSFTYLFNTVAKLQQATKIYSLRENLNLRYRK